MKFNPFLYHGNDHLIDHLLLHRRTKKNAF